MLYELAVQVRKLALEVAQTIQKTGELQIHQKGEKDFVTGVDLKISELLCEKLPKLLEGSIVISEEGYQEKPSHHYCWIIDPIDGTNNLIYTFPAYAISIGLLEDGKPVLGVVYNPKREEMFWAVKGGGAFCNGQKISVRKDSAVAQTLILAETNPYCDRKKNQFHKVMDHIFNDCVDYRITGSAALDFCYIACGRGGAFVGENLKPWDYAGGAVILEEAGGRFTQWDGKESSYFGGTTALASNGFLHNELLERLKDFA